MTDLGAHYRDVPDYYWPLHHPRPPAALLLQAPSLLMSPTTVLHWGGLFMVGSLLVVLVAAAVTSRLPAWKVLAFGPLIALSPQLLFQYEWAKFGTGVVPAVAVGLALVRIGRVRGAGLAFGIAAAVQLWPAILLVGLVRIGARRAAVQGTFAGLVLTLVGLALPGVSVSGTLDVLRFAGDYFLGSFANGSVAGVVAWLGAPQGVTPFVFMAGIAVWLWGLTQQQSQFWFISWSLMAGLIISPLSWGLYWLTAIPVVFWLITRTEKLERVLSIAALIALATLIVGFGVLAAGIIVMTLLGRLVPQEIDFSPQRVRPLETASGGSGQDP